MKKILAIVMVMLSVNAWAEELKAFSMRLNKDSSAYTPTVNSKGSLRLNCAVFAERGLFDSRQPYGICEENPSQCTYIIHSYTIRRQVINYKFYYDSSDSWVRVEELEMKVKDGGAIQFDNSGQYNLHFNCGIYF